jgi:ParB-like chromosome segregation protein Spo0J
MKKGFQSVAIDQLVKADWNYKEDNAELLEKLVNNIKRNGQIENIIIRELDTGFLEVVNGNHRLDALKVIGAEEVYCFNLGTISEAQAKRIAIETNETKFSSNQDNLSAILLELVDDFDIEDLLDTMPFDESVFIGAENYEPEVEEQEEEEEEIPEPEIIQTRAGDLYELNGHKLLCGDCTKKESVLSLFGEKVANLIVIDPPYGVDYAEKNKLLNRAGAISGKVYGT